MDKESVVLAALAAAKGATHTPVQVQKLFFLIDRKASAAVGGPHFNFQPYDYGPFDRDVYLTIERLAAKGLAEVIVEPDLRWRRYRLTETGQEVGAGLLASVEPKTRDYIERVSDFVREQPFGALVSAIYKAYPEMKVNSVFRG